VPELTARYHFELTNHHISSYDRGASVTADDKHCEFFASYIDTNTLLMCGEDDVDAVSCVWIRVCCIIINLMGGFVIRGASIHMILPVLLTLISRVYSFQSLSQNIIYLDFTA
jgi:hypothetical protein